MIALFSPKVYIPICCAISRWIAPCVTIISPILLFWIIFYVPSDLTQGSVFRIIYIHVPMALASMLLFIVVGVMSMLHWVLHIKVADWIATAASRIGLFSTVVTLVTGSIWGYYTWGTWWVWDARLTSMLMLFFIYLAYIITDEASNQYLISKQALVIISVIGMVDIPLIHYSVTWWQSLHQGSTLLNLSNQTMPWEMLWPLILAIILCAMTTTLLIAHFVKYKTKKLAYESSAL